MRDSSVAAGRPEAADGGAWPPLLAPGLMALATVIALVVIGLAAQDQALKGDEWGYAGRLASAPTLEAILEPPPGKYLIALPLLVYEGLLETAGADDYFPFRLVGMLLTATVAWLVFAFVRRRVGAIPALAAGLLLLFFGAATEVVAQPLRLPSQFAIAAGIGAWLALEGRSGARNAVACVLLFIAVSSHPAGLAFLAGAVVLVVGRGPKRSVRDWWIFGAPAVGFLAWWTLVREEGAGAAGTLSELPAFVAKELSTVAAALTGVFRDPLTGSLDFVTPAAWLALVALVAALVLSVWRRGLDWRLLAVAVALAVSLLAPAFASGDARDPESVRYLYPNAVLLILFAAEACRGFRLRREAPRAPVPAVVGLAVALFGFAMFSNVATLLEEAPKLGDRSERLRAQISGLELARDCVDPSFRTSDIPDSEGLPRSGFATAAGNYLRASSAYGTPAFTPAELAERDQKVRAMADVVLTHAVRSARRACPAEVSEAAR